MNALLPGLMLMALLAPVGLAPLHAQQSADTGDDTSRQVEESDEAFRRRMELEDARQRDLGYTPPPDTYPEKQEKINKLPEESRDNIREQLVDMIVENGDWEPSDALEEQPYTPTPAAMADPELMRQEQEAWDEQIEKYNRREAAAYGALRGPVPGPGNPTGEEGAGQEGSEGDGAGQTGGQQGGDPGSAGEDQESGQEENPGSAGTYQPYQSNRSRSDDATSTAGVQQSALDFLKGQQGQVQARGTASVPNAQGSAQPTAQSSVAQSSRQSAAQSSQVAEQSEQAPAQPEQAPAQPEQAPAQPEQAPAQPEQVAEQPEQASQDAGSSKTVEIDLSTPGIIAIKDLDKLEGTENPESPEDPERR